MSGAGDARVYMDASITRNRSLSRRGFRLLLAAVVAYNLAVMVFLLALKAFPVPIFLGLDVVGLYVAMRASNRRAEVVERVQVTADQVQVSRGAPGRERTLWRSPTAFTRVAVERAEDRPARVRLLLSQRSLDVGGDLSAPEREDFGEALRRAIQSALAERYPGST